MHGEVGRGLVERQLSNSMWFWCCYWECLDGVLLLAGLGDSSSMRLSFLLEQIGELSWLFYLCWYWFGLSLVVGRVFYCISGTNSDTPDTRDTLYQIKDSNNGLVL